MRALCKIFIALLGSFVLYAATFGLLLHRPITLDSISEWLEAKTDYAATLKSPRLLLFAGSNGLYSHSCGVLESELGIGCVSMSMPFGMGLDFLVQELDDIARPGDVIYMPMEYQWYSGMRRDWLLTSYEAPELFYHDRHRLWSLGVDRFWYGLFSFDIAFAARSVTEMAATLRPMNGDNKEIKLDKWGDFTGHTPERAERYRAAIATMSDPIPEPAALEKPSDGRNLLAQFLESAHLRNITVIGGLPTVFDDRPIPSSEIKFLETFYQTHQQYFLTLSNNSQYKRQDFFDSNYHLNSAAQTAHSRTLASALKENSAFIKAFGPR